MSTDKWATSNVYTTSNKSLAQIAPYVISSMPCFLPKQSRQFLCIIQKAMPIILTLFSTKIASYYSQIILGMIC